MTTIDFVVVPGLAAMAWSEPHPDHPGHSGMLGAHRGAMGPFPTQEQAVTAALDAGFDPAVVVIPRRTR